MAEVFFDNPPALAGTEKEQLLQLQRYLNAMSEKLNQSLMQISLEQMEPETKQAITGATEKAENTVNGLKSMIVKTASIIRHEMDVISATLNDNYQALSDQFGAYERNLQSEITATAEGILKAYQYAERVSGLEDEAGNTDVFIRRINQYIFSGLIDEVNGKYGIAIGENVTSYDAQGNPFLNNAQKMATFTMDRLSFWQGGTEVAYFASDTFYIRRGEVLSSLQMGNHTWNVMPDGSIGLVGN